MDTEIDWASLHKDATTTLEGEFPVVVTKATAGQSQGGKPQIKITMKIESGPFVGRQLFDNMTVSAESSAAMRIFFAQMAVFGLDGQFFAGNPSMDEIARTLEHRRAVAVVGVRQWNGQDREDVKEYKPPLGVGDARPAVAGGLAGIGINPGGAIPAAGPIGGPAPTTPASAPVSPAAPAAESTPAEPVAVTTTTPLNDPPKVPF